ncbi:hypothetical protein [Paenibacillus riograndensis]|uniref:hypothetical protein n=1 Tax=Paenibacillus riograndensis TaxID=483937 RepID=UPI0012FE2637|nr:hypothetical protein [Paenibacillus riograndensis]
MTLKYFPLHTDPLKDFRVLNPPLLAGRTKSPWRVNSDTGLMATGIPHRSKINGGMLKTDRCTPSRSIRSRYGQESGY